jgi:hypothetical protein
MISIYQVTICAAAELQQTNFMTRLNFDSKDKKPDLDPYVAVDVDEVSLSYSAEIYCFKRYICFTEVLS